MKTLEQEFRRFVEERKWLKNVTPKTLTWYEEAFKLLTKLLPDLREPGDLTKPTLNMCGFGSEPQAPCELFNPGGLASQNLRKWLPVVAYLHLEVV
jgi:hypothetical protein